MKIIECPRDAMQGIEPFIPTEQKIRYLNKLLRVGFDTVDMGSFVSPKAIPQLRDTGEILEGLDLEGVTSDLLVIVANSRGAKDACQYEAIRYLGFPFSISETFQQKNTNASIEESLDRVQRIKDICDQHGKELVIYVSMAFGNPYGDPWSPELASKWTHELAETVGVKHIALADTIGSSTPESIGQLFSALIPAFPDVEIGAHLHTHPDTWREKVEAAWSNGCRRFDSALNGYGGCPMAEDDLVGNMATENVLTFLDEQGVDPEIDRDLLKAAMEEVGRTFPE